MCPDGWLGNVALLTALPVSEMASGLTDSSLLAWKVVLQAIRVGLAGLGGVERATMVAAWLALWFSICLSWLKVRLCTWSGLICPVACGP